MCDNKETDIVLDWWESYVRGNYRDPHQEFAERQGISRQEAKVLCYKVAFQLNRASVMRGFHK